jgi:hypothetical protein
MFVILTTRPGIFRTEPTAGVTPVEAWDYLFCGALRARFTIAALAAETRVRVVDETPPPATSVVPTKFLPRFATLEEARRELGHLTGFGAARHGTLRPAAAP